MFMDMNKQLILKLIPLIIVISTIIHVSSAEFYTEKKSTDRTTINKLGKGNDVKLFCKIFGFEKFYMVLSDEDDKIRSNKRFKECKNAVLPYFDKKSEPDNSITKYAGVCVEKKISATKCGNIMDYFNDYDWDMITLLDLLRNINADQYINTRASDYHSIQMKRQDWYSMRFDSFHVGKCLDEFLNSSENESKDVIKHYKDWYSTKKNLGYTPTCNCVDVFGTWRIFLVKEKERFGESEIFKYFEQFCTNDWMSNHFWTKKQYEAIAKDATNIKNEYIVSFLKVSTRIAESGWFDGNKNREWTFSYISNFIGVNYLHEYSEKPGFFDERIDLISSAIKYSFTEDDFNVFHENTNLNAEFNGIICKYKILHAVFNTVNEDLIQPLDLLNRKKDKNNYQFWEKNDKKLFNNHLMILINRYKKEADEMSCETFTAKLKKIEKLFYKTKWLEETFTQLFKNENKKTIDDIYNCLKKECDELNIGPEAINSMGC